MKHTIGRRGAALALVAAGGLLAAGCGHSSGSTNAAATGGGSAAKGGSATVTVMTHKGPLGTYLTDAQGRTLYVFGNDKGHTSTCYGSCVHFWLPLAATGSVTASSGAQSAMVATTTRHDGSKQVTYAGHPLYTYIGDSKAGQTTGQGVNLNGGLWYVVAPTGAPITHAGAAPASSSTSSSSGGGWG